jgi:hypothetical protein
MTAKRKKKGTARKRGAQTHNVNAIKHGLYSKRFQRLSGTPLIDLQEADVEAELQLLRVMISRHLAIRAETPPLTPQESLTDLRVISFAVARLVSLLRLQKSIPADAGVTEAWLQDLLKKIADPSTSNEKGGIEDA